MEEGRDVREGSEEVFQQAKCPPLHGELPAGHGGECERHHVSSHIRS